MNSDNFVFGRLGTFGSLTSLSSRGAPRQGGRAGAGRATDRSAARGARRSHWSGRTGASVATTTLIEPSGTCICPTVPTSAGGHPINQIQNIALAKLRKMIEKLEAVQK